MGTFRDDTSFPRDSDIYWYGSGLSTTRILNRHLKKNTRKGGPKVKCLLTTKRDRWVAFLNQRKEHTKIKLYSDSEKRELRTVRHTQGQVRERIATVITTPNESWAKRKKQKKLCIKKEFLRRVRMIMFLIRYEIVCCSMTLDVQQ